MSKEKKNKGTPEFNMNPYVFTVLLFLFGSWFFYDGWLTTDPEMQKHALFNKVMSLILLPWSIYDFFKIKKLKIKNEKSDQNNG